MSGLVSPMASFRNSVARHIPPGELFRYLPVGALNTLLDKLAPKKEMRDKN